VTNHNTRIARIQSHDPNFNFRGPRKLGFCPHEHSPKTKTVFFLSVRLGLHSPKMIKPYFSERIVFATPRKYSPMTKTLFLTHRRIGFAPTPIRSSFTFRINYLLFALHIYILHSQHRIERSIPHTIPDIVGLVRW